MYTREQVAARIDHAVLKPQQTDDDVRAAARMCRERGVGCLCVRPCDVRLAAAELAGSRCVVASVIGFPQGVQRPEVKALEARLALDAGARELDMVMNLGRFLSGDHAHVRHDIEGVVGEAHPRRALVKVILETCWLQPGQIAEACRIAQSAGADYVKTSTGFADGGATPEAVDIMLRTVGTAMKVKASGGIRTWEQAVGYLRQGCDRLGIGATEAVLDGGTGQGTY
jgi:deoxyribose-phosphate aldolase